MSRQITLKFSQGLVRIQTRTRTRRHCGGPRPRRLTKTLQQLSQCPTGEDRSHVTRDTPTSDWCERTRDTRQSNMIHVSTCTTHSGVKKTHDWSVEQLPDLFRTTHRVETQEVTKTRGQ